MVELEVMYGKMRGVQDCSQVYFHRFKVGWDWFAVLYS